MRAHVPPFSADYLRSILDYDQYTGVFRWKVKRGNGGPDKGEVAGYIDDRYRKIKINQRYYRAQNLAWYYMKGEWPEYQIDHKNTDSLDNRFDNLRPATHVQNCYNRNAHVDGSGFKGVSWKEANQKWQVQITKDYKTTYLGLYEDLEEAIQVYKNKAIELFGEYVNFN